MMKTLCDFKYHHCRLQMCENNWIRRIPVVKIAERRRMKDLREEVGTKACIVGKIVKSRMKWAGHVVRMKDKRLPKRSETKKHRGCRKRGNSQLRLSEERTKKVRGGRKWRENTNNREQWKKNNESSRTVEWRMMNLTPTKGIREEEQLDCASTDWPRPSGTPAWRASVWGSERREERWSRCTSWWSRRRPSGRAATRSGCPGSPGSAGSRPSPRESGRRSVAAAMCGRGQDWSLLVLHGLCQDVQTHSTQLRKA